MIEKNDTSINDATNELDDLLRLWSATGWNKHRRYHTALTALVAERNSLKQRVSELESQEFTLPHDPFRDADRDLRERLVESALQGAARDAHMHHEASSMGTRAVYIVDAAIAAMRKGDTNGK